MALHKYHKDHVPACLQPFINEKLRELVKIGELVAIRKEKTPAEYRLYVRERDNEAATRSDSGQNDHGKKC